MESRLSSDLVPAVAVDRKAAGSAVAPVPVPVASGREEATARPGDLHGRKLRRLLLAADIVALCGAFLIMEASFGTLAPGDLVLFPLSIPVWVTLAYSHRLYHLDSYRADYGAADEIGPVLQMVTLGAGLRCSRSPRCERITSRCHQSRSSGPAPWFS
jgi:hypothetical protein